MQPKFLLIRVPTQVDNFSVGYAVVIFSYFGLELRERFPHNR